jgi:hypothetical protein
MPSISGPSITSSGRAASARASSVSASTKSTMPCTSAWDSRCATGASRHDRSTSRFVPDPVTVPANVTSRSVASSRRSNSTSSTSSKRSAGMSWYTASWPALTMPMSRPACTAWNRNAEWIASRTTSLPRKENDRFEIPPDVRAPGQRCLISGSASRNAFA